MRSGPDELQVKLSTLRTRLEKFFSDDTAARGFRRTIPSEGHCAAVALIAHELMGGDLVSATVFGESHWFNRLKGDQDLVDIDITGDQFGLPTVQIAHEGRLYPGTRIRSRGELHQETIERALILAERAGLDRVSSVLRDYLNTDNIEVVRSTR